MWISIIVFLILNSILWKQFTNSGFADGLQYIIRALTGQTVHKVSTLDSEWTVMKDKYGSTPVSLLKLKYTTYIILTIIWILCATLLSKCFSSVILNTYFNINSKTIINSFDELLAQPEIGVYSIISKRLRDYGPKMADILDERHAKYVKHVKNEGKRLNVNHNLLIMKDLLRGKAVYLIDSYMERNIKAEHPSLNLVVADDRRGYSYLAYTVPKTHTFGHLIAKR